MMLGETHQLKSMCVCVCAHVRERERERERLFNVSMWEIMWQMIIIYRARD